MPRLFTGLEIPSDVGFALSLKRGGLSGARWIAPENYHITLRFIGDTDHQTANEIADLLNRFTDMEPFAVNLTHLGVFGGNKPRSLYAGVEINDQLTRLQAAHDRAFQQIGLEPEGRKFTPHITLARLRGTSANNMARFMADAAWFSPLMFTAARFVLYSAKESVGGGPYIVEEAYDLAA